MKQEQAWFDSSNMFEFSTKIQTQIKVIENGVRKILIIFHILLIIFEFSF